MKVLNIVLMVLMAGLALREVGDIVQRGATGQNVLFCLLFTGFAIRRFILLRGGSTAKM